MGGADVSAGWPRNDQGKDNLSAGHGENASGFSVHVLEQPKS